MAEPSVLQKKTEIFLERDIYPLLKNFPASEKFSLCQEIKQSCYKLHPGGCYGQQPHERQQAAHVAG